MSDFEIGPADGPITARDLEWQRAAERLEFTTLPAIRASAEKWAGTVGTLLGVLAIAAVIKGPDDLNAITGSVLGFDARSAVIALAGLSVLLSTIAVASAAFAAQGAPVSLYPTGDLLRTATEAATRKAASALRVSRFTAIAAVPALALAVGLIWIKTPTDGSRPLLLVTTHSGKTICGSLNPSSDELRLDTGRDESVVAFRDLTEVRRVESCP